jgi:thioredoxin reductase (NADPH)
MEAQACADGVVAIVGGGNSAGQAALFLTRTCIDVHLIIRGENLASSMSRYLIDEIAHHPQIHVIPRTEVVGLIGEKALDRIELTNNDSGDTSTLSICGLFIFIGATPSTQWIDGQLAEDDHGFLLTGTDIPPQFLQDHRVPLLLETSEPGIFCVGDVRSGSVKRVATAIGEGSMAVRLVFDRLRATGFATADSSRADAPVASSR